MGVYLFEVEEIEKGPFFASYSGFHMSILILLRICTVYLPFQEDV